MLFSVLAYTFQNLVVILNMNQIKQYLIIREIINLGPMYNLLGIFFSLRCDVTCFGCSGPGERNCTSCPNGYILDTGLCVVGLVCKDGECVSPTNFLIFPLFNIVWTLKNNLRKAELLYCFYSKQEKTQATLPVQYSHHLS